MEWVGGGGVGGGDDAVYACVYAYVHDRMEYEVLVKQTMWTMTVTTTREGMFLFFYFKQKQ